MPIWEYFQLQQALALPVDALNSLGQQGWELIGAYEAQVSEKSGNYNFFVFKRLRGN
jgi:hypothetical protein